MIRQLSKLRKLTNFTQSVRRTSNSLRNMQSYCFSEDLQLERGRNRVPLNLNQDLENFELLRSEQFPDFQIKLNFFRHKVLGMHWFHFESEDLNNSLAFVFRTLPDDDTGKPHILEHTGIYTNIQYYAEVRNIQ